MQKYDIREKISESFEKEFEVFSDLTKHLLFHRGIKTKKEAESFLNPDYENGLYDPYLLKDMDRTVKRILKAISKKEMIGIFSDYDADGIPGAVVLSDFFKKINYEKFEVYIPHRNDEGYGMNHTALDYLKEKKVKLLITIDCGISDIKEVDYANSLDMDVIVTDHHLPQKDLPKAFAIINPKQSDCQYPDKMLCGSGVIFKVICAILKSKGFKEKYDIKDGWEKWLLDMVGLATLSDMVPLLDENRVLAYYGLKVLKKSPRHGLTKLFSLLKIDRNNLTEDDIGFLVTPRINVASRMGKPDDAFFMLSSSDESKAFLMAEHLHKINDERKGLVGSMTKEIKKIIEDREDVLRDVIVIGNPDWKPSVLGLVANSFSDEHRRPVFIWGRENENDGALCKGSCRAGNGVSIMSLMTEAKDIFYDFGGHKQAGGFSVLFEKIHLLEDVLNLAYTKISHQIEEEKFFIDKILSPDEVNFKLFSELEKFSPFGIENPKPTFLFHNVKIKEVKLFGKEKNHLELLLERKSGKPLSAIAFFKKPSSFAVSLESGSVIDLVANIEKSTFRNFPELRLRIVDIIS
jgi:single-stranded-DNA-specific exonuclease